VNLTATDNPKKLKYPSQVRKIYIAGKIGGLTEDVYTNNFMHADLYLWAIGHDTINPVELPHEHERTWKAYMKEDLNALKTCCTLYALNNWEDSRGARIEVWFAKRYNKTIFYQP
jgi:hypothetical protein